MRVPLRRALLALDRAVESGAVPRDEYVARKRALRDAVGADGLVEVDADFVADVPDIQAVTESSATLPTVLRVFAAIVLLGAVVRLVFATVIATAPLGAGGAFVAVSFASSVIFAVAVWALASALDQLRETRARLDAVERYIRNTSPTVTSP